jgi:hypothetical protein
MTTRLAIVVLVSVSVAGPPFAADAKQRHVRHHTATVRPATSLAVEGVRTPQSGAYGASGISVGSVPAPSVGSYSWPSVGVTNAVPTWSNTSPALRK